MIVGQGVALLHVGPSLAGAGFRAYRIPEASIREL